MRRTTNRCQKELNERVAHGRRERRPMRFFVIALVIAVLMLVASFSLPPDG